MNYSQLVSAIQSYTENDFPGLTTSPPSATFPAVNTFIQQAEQRIYNAVQLPAIRRNVTGVTTAGNRYLTIPTDWLATFSLAVVDVDGNYQYLLNKDVNFIRAAYPTPYDQGLPEYYAIFDATSFILGPTPDAMYGLELHYYYYPESIVTAGTTWLGDNFDSALLYGSLIEAYTYMKGEQDVSQEYQKRYEEAMGLLKQLGDGKDRRDAYRSGQVRYPVK
jgi:hypothetical protein